MRKMTWLMTAAIGLILAGAGMAQARQSLPHDATGAQLDRHISTNTSASTTEDFLQFAGNSSSNSSSNSNSNSSSNSNSNSSSNSNSNSSSNSNSNSSSNSNSNSSSNSSSNGGDGWSKGWSRFHRR